MATSGNFITSDSGQGGGGYFGQLIFEWWRTDWGRSGSSGYHNISYSLKTYGGMTNYWKYVNSSYMEVDGTGYSGGKVQAYGGGATTLLSGSKTLWTDGAGNRSFGAYAQGAIYTSGVNTTGSGSWSMDNIPMYGNITNTSGNFNDSNYNPWIEFSNPAGGATQVWFELPNLTGATRYAQRNDIGSRYTWTLTEAEMNSIRSAMANVNSTTVRYKFANHAGSWVERAWDATISIINANPTFTNFTYSDTNATTVAITGNNQYLIQGYSTLQAKVPVANKAVALKSATMVKYLYSVAGLSSEKTWSNTVDVNNDIGVLTSGTNQTLTITARDSRNKETAVSETVNIVPYTAPVVNASAVRVNNFEATTNIHIEGVVSMLDVSGVKKNTVNSTSGVQYRYRESGGTWGSWTNRASSLNTTTGVVTTTDFTLSLDNTKEYDFEFKVTDKLTSSTVATTVNRGIAIMRVSTSDDLIYNKEQPLMTSHVGMIIQTTTLSTAGAVSAIYGGTWVAWGTGRTPVGVDTGQTEFNTVEKTGGAKTNTLTTAQMPSHRHGRQGGGEFVGVNSSSGGNPFGFPNGSYYTLRWGYEPIITATGGDQPHNNLQPYITAYMWKRTV